MVKGAAEFPGPCCHPCMRPRQKFSAFKIFRLFLVVIILTMIFISWSYAFNTTIREVFGLGESIRDTFIIAVICTVLGIGILKLLNVKPEDAIGMDLE